MHSQSRLISYLSRRGLLRMGLAAMGGTAAGASGALGQAENSARDTAIPSPDMQMDSRHTAHGAMLTVGSVDDQRNGFDPNLVLTDWNTGTVSAMAAGRPLRTFEITAEDKEIEIAPGVAFP